MTIYKFNTEKTKGGKKILSFHKTEEGYIGTIGSLVEEISNEDTGLFFVKWDDAGKSNLGPAFDLIDQLDGEWLNMKPVGMEWGSETYDQMEDLEGIKSDIAKIKEDLKENNDWACGINADLHIQHNRIKKLEKILPQNPQSGSVCVKIPLKYLNALVNLVDCVEQNKEAFHYYIPALSFLLREVRRIEKLEY